MLPSSTLVLPVYPLAQPNHQTVSGDLPAAVRIELPAFSLGPAGWLLRIRLTPSGESSNHRIISRSPEFERTTFQTVAEESGDSAREGIFTSLWLEFTAPNFGGSRAVGSLQVRHRRKSAPLLLREEHATPKDHWLPDINSNHD